MSATNVDSPQAIARNFREDAIRVAEEEYKKALDEAANVKETTINNATEASSDVIKQAKNVIEKHKQRLNESKDRIEFKLRKQEMEEARRTQERLIISSDDNRIKAIKQAQPLYKKSIIDAEDTRSKAIQQAYSDEKNMILEAKNKLKTEKRALKTKLSDKHKTAQDTNIAFTNQSRQTISERPSAPVKLVVPEKSEESVTSGDEPRKTVTTRPEIIKLIITQAEVNPTTISVFENELRSIPGVHFLMTGGTTKADYQIIVNAEAPLVLADSIKQLSNVEKVNQTSNGITIKLVAKPVS
jgi:hypothetical protein